MAIKLEINITNKWLYSLIAFGILLALGVGVYAYQSNMRAGNPPVMGHSAGEINVENSTGQVVSLQDALDSSARQVVSLQDALDSLKTTIIGSEDGYAGQTGHQACLSIGKTCQRVISYNYIREDGACTSATHCMRVCMTWYNQNLPGVENGGKDNIHSCDALLGDYTTYLHGGVVRCNAHFSAICS